MTPTRILLRLHAALEAGICGEDLRGYFTDDAVTTEYPNRIRPKGGVLPLSSIIDDSVRGAALLRRQHYDVHASYDVGDTAIVRLTWTGEIASAAGPFTEGQVLTAHIAQFVQTRDGRVASIATYDCYDDFGAVASA